MAKCVTTSLCIVSTKVLCCNKDTITAKDMYKMNLYKLLWMNVMKSKNDLAKWSPISHNNCPYNCNMMFSELSFSLGANRAEFPTGWWFVCGGGWSSEWQVCMQFRGRECNLLSSGTTVYWWPRVASHAGQLCTEKPLIPTQLLQRW